MPRGAVDPDAQIDALIAKRAAQTPADGEREELWMGSVRRYHQERTEDFTQAWYQHHRHLAVVHAEISDEHSERADFLEGLLAEKSARAP